MNTITYTKRTAKDPAAYVAALDEAGRTLGWGGFPFRAFLETEDGMTKKGWRRFTVRIEQSGPDPEPEPTPTPTETETPKMSKSARARELLAAGWTVADTAREVDAHYSQVHGIYRKMQANGAGETVVVKATTPKAGRKPVVVTATKPEPEPTVDSWAERPDDTDAGDCANCGFALVERSVSYAGKDYGRALIHRNVGGDPAALKIVQLCKAERTEA